MQNDGWLARLQPRRVAVLRALQLGDLLCAVPALRALRAAVPAARVTLVGLPGAAEFVRRFGEYLDELLPLAGFPGLPEQPFDARSCVNFLARLDRPPFDLVVQLHGSGRVSNILALLLGGRRTAGYYEPGHFCPDTETFWPYPAQCSEVDRCLNLAQRLGAAPRGRQLEFPLTEQDQREFAAVAEAHGLGPEPLVVLHPGARSATRRWPAERFASVARSLMREGLRVAVTGSADEQALTARVAALAGPPLLDLGGQTTLGGWAALIAQARLVVTNDTAASHLAAALGVPCVTIVLASQPHRWRSGHPERQRMVFHPVVCRPCPYETCPIGFDCAQGVTVGQVLREARGLLHSNGLAAATTSCMPGADAV